MRQVILAYNITVYIYTVPTQEGYKTLEQKLWQVWRHLLYGKKNSKIHNGTLYIVKIHLKWKKANTFNVLKNEKNLYNHYNYTRNTISY